MKKEPVKEPRQARIAINKLHGIFDVLDYYLHGAKSDPKVKTFYEDMIFIEDVLHDLAIEKKIDHIRLATKLKKTWDDQEAKKKKEEEKK